MEEIWNIDDRVWRDTSPNQCGGACGYYEVDDDKVTINKLIDRVNLLTKIIETHFGLKEVQDNGRV